MWFIIGCYQYVGQSYAKLRKFGRDNSRWNEFCSISMQIEALCCGISTTVIYESVDNAFD
jgi:hypothetical protein